MRKAFLGILVAVTMLSAGTITTSAAGAGVGRYYIDANGDGICDNYATGRSWGRGRGYGRNFVDANGDGICDNYGTGRFRGNGRGCGFRGGRGR